MTDQTDRTGSRSGLADDASPGLPAGMPVPASIEAAWGIRPRSARGARPGLSLDRVVAAAIAVADAEGLPAVSMGRVAAELGSSPMALYRYVGSKDELLVLMLDAEMGPAPVLTGTWREQLTTWCLAALERYLQAPWSVRLAIPAPPITPNQIRWLEAGLRAMEGTGLTEPEKLSTVLLLSGQARYLATVAADFADAMKATGGVDPSAGYGATLLRLVPEDEFPAVHAAARSGTLDDDGSDFTDEQMTFYLDVTLDGLEALMKRRRRRGTP